jgi:hypothetical protein
LVSVNFPEGFLTIFLSCAILKLSDAAVMKTGMIIFYSAVKEDEPFNRMKSVVKWYLSGFYKKPKGLKKPYNPILGETFRCYWEHPNGTKTFYIAEQVWKTFESVC